MREKARAAINGLARLAPRGALLLAPNGSRRYVPLDEIVVGDEIAVAVGERIPVDGMVVVGESDLDLAIVTGESTPVAVASGVAVSSGAMVASLDAKLSADPNNFEGWVRLVRSYAVLNDKDRAADALKRGLAAFPLPGEQGSQLLALARELGISTEGLAE